MNDNDIIKALECCRIGKRENDCKKCPLYGRVPACVGYLTQDALALINRQKAEIDRLNHIRAELSKEIDKLRDMVAQNEGVLPRYEQLIKAEAIKEFAEKLKSDIDPYQFIEEFYINAELAYEVRMDWFNEIIDNLVKEMTED
jgi:hypothetical protein